MREREASGPRSRRGNRGRSVVLGGTVLGAALALLAVSLTWVEQRYGADASSRLARQGFQAAPAVVPLTVVALAGLAAAYAGRGLVGRLIGVVLAAAGIALSAQGLLALIRRPPNATAGDTGLPAPAELMGPVQVHWVGPVLTLAGGLAIAACGVAVLAGAIVRRLGTRYDAPASVAGRPLTGDVADGDAAAAWWKALDAGHDPTELAAPDPYVDEDGAVRSDRFRQLP